MTMDHLYLVVPFSPAFAFPLARPFTLLASRLSTERQVSALEGMELGRLL
jgi:hypothetical protein